MEIKLPGVEIKLPGVEIKLPSGLVIFCRFNLQTSDHSRCENGNGHSFLHTIDNDLGD